MRIAPWALGGLGIVALGAGAVLLGRGASSSGPQGSATPAPALPAGPASFVGAASCAECHAEIAAAWSGSHHAQAMQAATPATVLGDFSGVRAEFEDRSATFGQAEGRYAVTTEGADGAEATFLVSHTFGLAPLQQYLLELPGGRLQPSAWAWDTRSAAAGGQRWYHLELGRGADGGLPPPGDSLHWTGYAQNANHTCIECHVTGFELEYDLEANRFASRWAEPGVGCEACHGPGSQHLAWAQAGADPAAGAKGFARVLPRSQGSWALTDGEDIAQWVGEPRPAELSQACYPCHSLRTRVAEQIDPDLAFLDQAMPRLLDEGTYHADGQIEAEVFVYGSFTQSRMHAAGVRCGDCHDPHTQALKAPGNALCTQCHRASTFDAPSHHFHAQDSPAAQCVNCHMPGQDYMGHDYRRDHQFAVPRPDLAVELGLPSACGGCHQDQAPAALAEWAVERWPTLGERPSFAPALAVARQRSQRAGPLLGQLIEDPSFPAIARATALTHLPGTIGFEDFRRVVEQALEDDSPLVRAAALRAVGVIPPELRWALAHGALEDPVRIVRLEAARALAGLAPSEAGAAGRDTLAAAVEELRRAEAVVPSRPENYLNLANLELALGRPQAAEVQLRQALRLDPNSAAAHVNLADVYRVQGRVPESVQALERAIQLEPSSAVAHHALGLARIRAGDKAGALQSLAEAARLQPDQLRFGYVYAVALLDAGRRPEARQVVRDLLAKYPGDAQLQGLAQELRR